MHYDDDALLEFAAGAAAAPADIEAHVATCSSCAKQVVEQRELIATLSDDAVWDRPVSHPRQFVVDVVAFAARARDEDEQAAIHCDEILTGPQAWWPQRLRAIPQAFTAGLVRQLLERWRPFVESAPSTALSITGMATDVANALDVAGYPCDYVVKLRAQAYRDHAFVLSFVGRHREALEFAERARGLFEQVPLPEYDLARLSVVTAIILRLMDRAGEALALIREAASTFLRFGDRKRYVDSRITEGAILYERRNIQEALDVWSSLQNEPGLDTTGAVRLAHNIALCHIDLGEPARAIPLEQRCVAEFEMLGLTTERTRSRWILARAVAACGHKAEALPVLRRTRREFEEFGMVADAGLVALEIVELLLLAGEPAEVPVICRDVIAQFTHAGMGSRAITALSFLREAIAIGQGSPSLVRHVREFLREVPTERPRLVAPSPQSPE